MTVCPAPIALLTNAGTIRLNPGADWKRAALLALASELATRPPEVREAFDELVDVSLPETSHGVDPEARRYAEALVSAIGQNADLDEVFALDLSPDAALNLSGDLSASAAPRWAVGC